MGERTHSLARRYRNMPRRVELHPVCSIPLKSERRGRWRTYNTGAAGGLKASCRPETLIGVRKMLERVIEENKLVRTSHILNGAFVDINFVGPDRLVDVRIASMQVQETIFRQH